VKAAALELGLPVSERVEDVLSAGAELGVVVAFGRIIKAEVLNALPLVNVHFSLLPRWRGAAPVERAILAGDTVTGVCLMGIDEGLDTGPVFRCEEVAIGAEETAAELRRRLAELGAAMLLESLRDGLGPPRPQEGEATYAKKLEPDDLHLNWSRPGAELQRVVRLGRAWTTWRGKRLLILTARLVPGAAPGPPGSLDGDMVSTGDGQLQLVTVQPEGRPAVAVPDWLRGARPRPGERLGA
jgi:methionyl-tRNA formyltransferase